MNFCDEFQRIMNEPNIHLKGVALRLRAMEQVENGASVPVIEAGLKQSEVFLMQSGDPIQTGKTHIEMARLKLREGDRDGAGALAEKARRDFANFMDVFFPDDLRPLLAIQDDFKSFDGAEDPLLGMFSDVIAEMSPSADFESLLAKTVRSTNRYFGAERGGVFWFRHGGPGKGMELRGACNLSQADINAPAFRENLTLVFRAFYENRPQILRRRDTELNPSLAKSMICVPFEVGGQVRGVLYHDNSYVQDCFDNLSNAQLMQMTRWLTSYIDHIHDFSRQLEQKTADRIGQLDSDDSESILTRSPFMMKILEQADRIAATDSTVLILGETGVGKELLARRIHRLSLRGGSPLITVDPTVIPESLVESELFGHEKGAFTGADRQKKGRMELAHKGTLFIDEVGEIPRSIQVKLLRVIQEKTMTRIGGTQTITSDFRLIAATNRNLAAEVAAGRFREDLYYRLNVIPMMLPDRKSVV
jgi:transcriptional regulator with GAF, ATPase, and Fis domain